LAGKKEDAGKERRKIEDYRTLVDQVNKRVSSNDFSSETLALITKLLVKNPEYYTIWNYRRRLLQTLLLAENANAKSILQDELNFLVPLLMQFPKCYWIWNYRIWVLHQAENAISLTDALQIWNDELSLASKMLSRDERNFHGWDYRRQIVAQIERLRGPKHGSMVNSEFEYTTKMIRRALQNFSALHYRSKLIPKLLNEQNATSEDRRKMFEKELDLMQEALIDPFNQSAWFYHAFLMATLAPNCRDEERILTNATSEDRKHYYEQEISRIKEMLEEFDDCKWIFQSLIQYSIEYVQFGNTLGQSSKSELYIWLREVKRRDPTRRGRWNDLQESLNL
jgi:geranylgeranyl transferase type-2 subunit alpha